MILIIFDAVEYHVSKKRVQIASQLILHLKKTFYGY